MSDPPGKQKGHDSRVASPPYIESPRVHVEDAFEASGTIIGPRARTLETHYFQYPEQEILLASSSMSNVLVSTGLCNHLYQYSLHPTQSIGEKKYPTDVQNSHARLEVL